MENTNLALTLRRFNILSEKDIEAAMACATPKAFKKGEYLIKAGTSCRWLAFINTGILRNYYINAKGKEVSYCLTFPGKFINATSSFITNKPTFENIQAITDAETLFIHKDKYLALVESSLHWRKLAQVLSEQAYVLMEERLLSLQMESAHNRYQRLAQEHPAYLDQVPAKYLASYIGVTTRHFSRLKKNPPA